MGLFKVGDKVVIKPNLLIPLFLHSSKGVGIVTGVSTVYVGNLAMEMIAVKNTLTNVCEEVDSEWFDPYDDPVQSQYDMFKKLYGSDSIKSPNDEKDQVLEDFAEAVEEADFDHLADLSTKRLTKKEEYDIMVVLSKLTWEDLK
jgi:hypothetical protein